MKLNDKSIVTYDWNYNFADKKRGNLVTQNDWNQTLITQINSATHPIRVNKKNVYKEDSEFWPLALITSGEGIAIMDSLEYFCVATNGLGDIDEAEMAGYISNTGELKDAKYHVYYNPQLPAKIIIAQREDLKENISDDCITVTIDIKGLPKIN